MFDNKSALVGDNKFVLIQYLHGYDAKIHEKSSAMMGVLQKGDKENGKKQILSG